jgi:hypothetical protein
MQRDNSSAIGNIPGSVRLLALVPEQPPVIDCEFSGNGNPYGLQISSGTLQAYIILSHSAIKLN